MSALNFSREELSRVVQACAALRLSRCTPSYLQDFLAIRLADHDPDLWDRISRLDAEEMDELCRYILDRQPSR